GLYVTRGTTCISPPRAPAGSTKSNVSSRRSRRNASGAVHSRMCVFWNRQSTRIWPITTTTANPSSGQQRPIPSARRFSEFANERLRHDTSSPWWKSGVAPRAARRPDGKARRPRISTIFEGEATQPAGCLAGRMQSDLHHGLLVHHLALTVVLL